MTTQRQDLKTLLQTVSNIAVLLASIAIIAALSWGYFSQRKTTELESGLRTDQVLKIPNVDFTKSDRTLVMVLSTTCRFCIASTNFYNKLANSARTGFGRTALKAVFPEDRGLVDRFVKENGMDPQIVTLERFDIGALNVNSTPTLILVDSQGRIVDFWIGMLSKEAEQQVLSTVQAD